MEGSVPHKIYSHRFWISIIRLFWSPAIVVDIIIINFLLIFTLYYMKNDDAFLLVGYLFNFRLFDGWLIRCLFAQSSTISGDLKSPKGSSNPSLL